MAPIVCAHRGASAHQPENTIAAATAAIDLGAAWIEFDVRPCASGELVVHHDPVTADGTHIGSTDRSALDPTIPSFAAWIAS